MQRAAEAIPLNPALDRDAHRSVGDLPRTLHGDLVHQIARQILRTLVAAAVARGGAVIHAIVDAVAVADADGDFLIVGNAQRAFQPRGDIDHAADHRGSGVAVALAVLLAGLATDDGAVGGEVIGGIALHVGGLLARQQRADDGQHRASDPADRAAGHVVDRPGRA